VEGQVRPTNLDVRMLKDLFRAHGGGCTRRRWTSSSLPQPRGGFKTPEELTERAYKEQIDDFAAFPVASAEELRQHVAERFYFGCEADM